MVDTLDSFISRFLLFVVWTCGQRACVVHMSTGLARRFRRCSPGHAVMLAIDNAEFDVGKANQPITIVIFRDTERLADQNLADEDKLAAPFDLAVGTHATHRLRSIINRFVQGARIGSGGGLVERGWCPLPQSFVRPLLIVLAAEAIKAFLLLAQRGGRRRGSLLLQ